MLEKLKLRSQIDALQPVLLLIYVPTFLFLILIWLVTKTTPIAAYYLVADPAEIANQPPYTGILSNIGIVFWSAAVAICWFSAGVIKKEIKHASRWKSFFIFSGIVTAVLLFDDLFEIHEQSPTFLNFLDQDSAELLVFGIYAMLLLTYFIKFKNIFIQTNFLVLMVGLSFFGCSLVIDMGHEKMLWEEAAKFIGIASWLAYFAETCRSLLRYRN